VRALLADTPTWQAEDLEAAIKQYCEAKGLTLGNVAQPIRVALSGTTVSPPIFQSLEFLGRDRSLTRIDRCLNMV
jgi:glutamyl-tRNA synthetase